MSGGVAGDIPYADWTADNGKSMIDVFVSRPSWVAPPYRGGLQGFLGLLTDLGLKPRTVGSTDYPTRAPLDEVIRVMDQCAGAVILGYPQIVATTGAVKDEPLRTEMVLPTEWNHIEAGLAQARGLPLLVIHHKGVCRGVFDRGAISSFIYEIDLQVDAWPLAENIRGAIQTWKTEMLLPRSGAATSAHKTGATTDDVYASYDKLGPDDDLLAWVATWPAFYGDWKEKVLERCRAKRLVVAGPVNRLTQLPGIFWRLDIAERRRGLSPLFLFAKELPDLKMIIAGSKAFLAPEPEGRTGGYYELSPASRRLTSVFLDDLEDARAVQEAVYTFLHRWLREAGLEERDSTELLELIEYDAKKPDAPPEVRSYEREWLEPLLEKWIPECVSWTEKHRGWNGLEVRMGGRAKFALRLRHSGRVLTNTHESRLRGSLPVPVLHLPQQLRIIPRLRIVFTNRCDLGCSYCPPENEDYAGGRMDQHTLTPDRFLLIVRAGLRCGFYDFAVTGGEPLAPAIAGDALVRTLLRLGPEITQRSAMVTIQTNGRHLGHYLGTLEPIRQILLLKVSVDALRPGETIAKSRVAPEVLQAIVAAKDRGFRVGVNCVLTANTADHVVSVAAWCREQGVYLKILDLNWYGDIGRRAEGLGAVQGLPSGDIYWDEQYVSPLDFYDARLRSQYGGLQQVPDRLGIPMFQTAQDTGGFFIRLKASVVGSHYSPECRECPFYVDRRRCQEGVYEPWITPGLRMKLCRHRPDIYEDLHDAVTSNQVEEVVRRMQRMLERFYWSSAFVPLQRLRKAV